jgi:hypothetical protein
MFPIKTFMKYLKMSPYILIILLSSWALFQRAEIADYRGNMEVLQVEMDTLEKAYSITTQNVREQSLQLSILLEGGKASLEESNRLESILEGYRNREETIIKKPALVESRINAGVSDILQSFERETSRGS